MRLHQRERYIFGIFPSESSHQNYGSGLSCYPAGENVLPRRPIAFLLRTALVAGSCGALFAQLTPTQLTPRQKADNLQSFEVVWRTVRDRHPDPNLNGLNWQAVHDSTKPAIENAESMPEVRRALTAMLAKLAASHYAIIPGDLYEEIGNPPSVPEEGSPGNRSRNYRRQSGRG